VAALLKSYEPSLDGTDLAQVLNRTALDVATIGRDLESGYGMVRADAAIEYIALPKQVLHGRISHDGTPGGLKVVGSSTIGRTFYNFPVLGGNGFYSGSCTQHALRGSGNWAGEYASTPDMWVRASGSAGWNDEGGFNGLDIVPSGHVVPGTATADDAEFETYVYKIVRPGLEVVWLPTDTIDAAIAYTTVGTRAGVTAVDDEGGEELDFEIIQNPVRGLPQIRLTLPPSGMRRLQIYDVAGRLFLRHDVHGRPGESLVVRPPDDGRSIAAGVYWLRCDGPSRHRVRRFVVLGPGR
jgi:hypothetical protein